MSLDEELRRTSAAVLPNSTEPRLSQIQAENTRLREERDRLRDWLDQAHITLGRLAAGELHADLLLAQVREWVDDASPEKPEASE